MALLGVLYIPGLARLTYTSALVECPQRLCRGAPAARRGRLADHAWRRAAQLPVAGDRAGHAAGGDRHHHRGRHQLRRPRACNRPTSSWGTMLAEARNFLFSGDWWLSLFPGLAISLTVIGFNLLGDGLRDVLDPRRNTAAFTDMTAARYHRGVRPAHRFRAAPRSKWSAASDSRHRRRGGRRAGGRVGLRQEHDGARHHAAAAARRRIVTHGEVTLEGRSAAPLCGPGHGTGARAGDRDDLPGPVDRAQSGVHRRTAIDRCDPRRIRDSAARPRWDRAADLLASGRHRRSARAVSPPFRMNSAAACASV